MPDAEFRGPVRRFDKGEGAGAQVAAPVRIGRIPAQTRAWRERGRSGLP